MSLCSHWEALLPGPWVSPPPRVGDITPTEVLSCPQTRLYFIAATVVALTYPVCSTLLYLGVKERSGRYRAVDRVWKQKLVAPLGHEFLF